MTTTELPHAGARSEKTPRKLSLVTLALIGSGLAGLLMCLIVSAILLYHARASVAEETDSAFTLASAVATFRLPVTFGQEDILAKSVRFAEEMDGWRHVSAWVDDPAGKRISTEGAKDAADPAPAWLVRLLSPPVKTDIFPIRQYPNVLGILYLSSDPSDEIAKTWRNLRLMLPLLIASVLAMIAVTLTVTLFVSKRLRETARGVAQIRDGGLGVPAEGSALAELDALSDGVNALTLHLADGRRENRALHEHMLTLAESERTRIASDLHDEIGPQLFALRAAVAQAMGSGTDATARDNALEAIERHAIEVQKTARAVIEDLSPITLDDASLEEELHELALNFAEIAPKVDITLSCDPGCAAGKAGELALYRFVRESVLNAIRHANPKQIRVTGTADQDSVTFTVTDDGIGPSAGARQGMGQSGIESRARAIGAVYQPPQRSGNVTISSFRVFT